MGLSKDRFFQQIHEYYGDHKNKIVMQITKEYILRTYKPESLRKLLNAIYRTHRSSWGYPDVAAIELAHDKFLKSDGVELKTKKETREYKSPIQPLTDEELIEAEESGAREKWEKMLENNTEKATETDKKGNCFDCEYKPVEQYNGSFMQSDECEGCFNPKSGERSHYKTGS